MNQVALETIYAGRGWYADLARCIDRLPAEFSLSDVYEFKEELSELHPENNTVDASVRKLLQNMRDAGHIFFVDGNGNYRKAIQISSPGPDRKIPSGRQNPPRPHSFFPEFSGHKKYKAAQDEVIAQVGHGAVVDRLNEKCLEAGKSTANSLIDLYLYEGRNRITHVFEVKTDITTTSIYTAIGQLEYHSAFDSPRPKRIIVLPGTPKSETSKILERLEIEIVEWFDSKTGINFRGLDEIIAD